MVVACSLSCVQLFVTPWTPPNSSVYVILQARTLGGLSSPPPGDLPDPGTEPSSPALTGRFFTTVPPGKPISSVKYLYNNVKHVSGLFHLVHLKLYTQ